MPAYRFYFLSADDHIKAAEVIECADGIVASAKADALLDERKQFAAIEVWNGKDIVHRTGRRP